MYKDKHKLEKLSERECECPISTTTDLNGNFNLECGDCLKIFESDEPVEIDMSITQSGSSNDSKIIVIVELHNGENLVFEIPKNDIFNTSNEIFFTTKQARKVTIECKSNSLDGGICIGSWSLEVILRGSETDCRCECPVQRVLTGDSIYELKSSENQVIFQSDKASEIAMIINLLANTDECTLTVIVELEYCNILKFVITAPLSGSNAINFYSKNAVKVTIECLTLTSCVGRWVRRLIYRGA